MTPSRRCVVCGAEYDPAEVPLPALTCSPRCLEVVDAQLRAWLAEGEPGPIERGLAARLAARRFPPVHAGHWLARCAVVAARRADRDGSPPPIFRLAVRHALDASEQPGGALDRIRAGLVLRRMLVERGCRERA